MDVLVVGCHLAENLVESTWSVLFFIGKLLVLERVLEPEGGDNLDLLVVKGPGESLGAAVAPDKMRDVLTQAATDLAPVLGDGLFEEVVCRLAIRKHFEVKDQALEQIGIRLHSHGP